MRTSLRRALAGASALVTLSAAMVLGATPASAEGSDHCPEFGSTRVVTANDGAYRVWLYQPSSGEVWVCFGVTGYVRGAYVFTTGLTGSLIPSVTPDLSDDQCPDYFHLQDPAEVLIRLKYSTTGPTDYVCFGTAGSAVRVSVTSPGGTVNPATHLWLDYGTTVSNLYCQYVEPNDYGCQWGYEPISVF